ncbi:protein NUCLEAR FUSION DEFECTIVE 2 [Silene latifolia]|uniref:protein NUCLEAR FUSION DEFECTIVE 2 n=1 Tax=Silene latifolia TaxID=37657 RepID=UPI003D7866B3
MMKMECRSTVWLSIFLLTIAIFAPLQIKAGDDEDEAMKQMITSYSPFPTALETLQKQIKYSFQHIDLLRRAMTHASFSEENNRALSILGTSIIETSISLKYIESNIDISSKVLNRKIAEISNVESSCSVDGMSLGLHKVVRVSHKTNVTSPAILCGAFRAIFGAIALDTGKSDDARVVFWNVHTGTGGVSAEL